MLHNFLKIALRNLKKQKLYSLLNIVGLAVGVLCCMLIVLYVTDELSYDRFNEHADRIHRIDAQIKFGDEEQQVAVASPPIGPELAGSYPQAVEQVVRLRDKGSFMVKKGSVSIREQSMIYADSTLFKVFSIPLVAGNPANALSRANTLVLSESKARKYFGSADPMGKVLVLNNAEVYEVTGVMQDMPSNAHFRFDIFLSMRSLDESKETNWLNHSFNTYLLLAKGVSPGSVEAKLKQVLEKNLGPQLQQYLSINSLREFERSGNYIRYSLMPLTRIHLHSDKGFELAPNGNVTYVYIFSAVALFILAIACINFVNLSTAKSVGRAKEVGIRKVMGSDRWLLIGQFLTESVVISLMAFCLALILAVMLLPSFGALVNKQIGIFSLVTPLTMGLFLGAAVLVGALAGMYPAFVISSFQPVEVLKGELKKATRGVWLRNVLVIFQFTTSTVLIVGTVIVYQQLHYIQSKKLGYNKDQVLVVNDAYILNTKLPAFKNEVLKLSGVQASTISGYLPVASSRRGNAFKPEGALEQNKNVVMEHWPVDHDYIKTMGMKVVQGRDFSRDYATDSSAVIINQAAARLLGYAEPVGKTISYASESGSSTPITIIGVVDDFHYESLRQNISPLCLVLENNPNLISIRLSAQNLPALVGSIEKRWKEMAPDQPFNYEFLDSKFDAIYQSEQITSAVATYFAMLGILVACLGLFGLASYITEVRTKEIGIRKVLGATETNILFLLLRDLLRLILLALLLAIPMAWWVMREWLASFAYRIEVRWPVLAGVAVLTLVVALATIGFQTIKAAFTNPVKSLKS